MRIKFSYRVASLLWILVFPETNLLSAQEAYFKGKTIRLIIGTSSGGGVYLYARLVAQFLGKHLSGGYRGVEININARDLPRNFGTHIDRVERAQLSARGHLARHFANVDTFGHIFVSGRRRLQNSITNTENQ